MTIRQQGGIFGRNPTFNNVIVDGALTADRIVEKTGAAGITLDGVTLKDGNVVLAGGKGIDFSATSGTGTSELFDDYGEGTWTPVVTDGTNTSTPLYAEGHYRKIGSQVTVYIALTNMNTVTASLSGAVSITGLPYASKTSLPSLMNYVGTVKFSNMSAAPLPRIYYNGTTSVDTGISASDITTDTADLYSVITYLTN